MCDRKKRTRKIYKPLFWQRGSNERDRVEQAATPLGLDRKRKTMEDINAGEDLDTYHEEFLSRIPFVL